MKTIIVAALTALSLTAVAQTQQITLDGNQSQLRAQLNGAVSRTEYRTEYRETTCTREVHDGYDQVCGWEPGETVCRTVGGGQSCGLTPSGRVCHDLPSHEECHTEPSRHVCHNEPRYRTEYYTCTKSVSVPYQVKLYDVQNNVVVNVADSTGLPAGLQEVLALSLSNEAVVLSSVRTTGKVLISATQSSQEISNNGQLKVIQTVVNVSMIDRLAAVGPFIGGISDITGDINTLQVTTGPITNLAAIQIELIAKKDRFLVSDKVVIQKILTVDDMELVNQGQRTLIKINFNKLGGPDKLSGKTAKIELKISTNVAVANLVNKQDMPAETSVTKKLKINF